MTKVEEVARAIAETYHGRGVISDKHADLWGTGSRFHKFAVSGLEAMRSPTEEMIEAGAEAYHTAVQAADMRRVVRNMEYVRAGSATRAAEGSFPVDFLEPVFAAMIDAALNTPASAPETPVERGNGEGW